MSADDQSTPSEIPALPFCGRDDNPRSREAARGFSWRSAQDGDRAGGEEFWRAYRALDAEFGPRGELEIPDDLLWEMYERKPDDRWDIRYHLLNFYAGDGPNAELAAVRDCYTMAQPKAGIVVVFLSHAIVLPAYRRSGLGPLIRTLPARLGREAAATLGMAGAEILLLAEMDPIDPGSAPTLIRMKAYGGSGFSFLPPQWLPYAQPDFSNWREARRDPAPVPLVLVTRWLGREEASEIPARLAWALYDSIDELHRTATPEDTAARRAFAERVLAGRDPVPLIGVDPGRPDRLEPLLRANVLPFLPQRLSGTGGAPVGDPGEELARLIAWEGWRGRSG